MNTKVTKEMSQNVEELDSLLDDLQKDQERQLYKSEYIDILLHCSIYVIAFCLCF